MPEKLTYEELEQRVRVLEQAEATFKRKNDGLDDSELWFRSLLETINEGVILQAASGDILAWNKRAEYYFGFTGFQSDNSKSSDKNLPLVYENGSKCKSKDHPFTKTLQTAKPCVDQIMGVYRTPNDLRWISINTNPLFKKKEEKPLVNMLFLQFQMMGPGFRRNIWKKYLNRFLQKRLWEKAVPDWDWLLYGTLFRIMMDISM